LGSPEGELAIAQAIVFMACAAKSNAVYNGVQGGSRGRRRLSSLEVPLHLRNAPTRLMKEIGYGKAIGMRTTSRAATPRASATFPMRCRTGVTIRRRRAG